MDQSHKRISTRARIAADLIAQGMPRSTAMRKAGYSFNYAKRGECATRSGKLASTDMLIRSAKERYIASYVKTALNVMPGDKIAKRLAKSAFSMDNTESTAAIKEQNRMMARAEHTANASTVNVGVFIVPSESTKWERTAKATITARIVPDENGEIGKK